MTYSVLILGATGTIGSKIAEQLALHKSQLNRTAFLTPLANAGPEKEAKYKAIDLERVVGSLTDAKSYEGFDIVISAVGDDLCLQQKEFIDAAFEGGVKHFYPAEFGADLDHPKSLPEAYFVNKIATRKYLEEKVKGNSRLGYTYILVGIFTEVILYLNVLGLSEDRKSASFIGGPDEVLSVASSVDVAKIVVTSLLPTHLSTLSLRRQIRFSGFTLKAKDLYSTFADVQGFPIEVKYISYEDTFAYAEKLKQEGNEFLAKFVSAMKSIGFGGADMRPVSNEEFPELRPATWEDAVKGFLGK